MIAPLGWDVRSQDEWSVSEAVENGRTFIENALIKARHACEIAGFPALGDDSGIVVDALGGRPGIHSARFAGEAGDTANNDKLLSGLRGVSDDRRNAHFYCVMVVVRNPEDPEPLISTGRWDGRIAGEPSGTGGFGYDPLFYVPEHNCTAAELGAEVKNAISHRGQALAGMMEQLRQGFDPLRWS